MTGSAAMQVATLTREERARWAGLERARAASGARALAAPMVVGAMAAGWAGAFAYLAIQRHLAGGSHAEDLGFTDQVLSNFLRGEWFRMSIYQGATWNTEIDLSRLARPDSLLAFHVEPMLLLLVPLYALGGMLALLGLQAVAVAAGALPAYRLGRHWSGSQAAGVAVAAAYLLSPLGQWAVLADFHTSTLAAPLLLLALERLIVHRSRHLAVGLAALALTAREDVGPVVAALGVALLWRERRTGLVLAALGLVWTAACVVILRTYSGGASPFDSIRLGNYLRDGVAAVWHGAAYQRFREQLYSSDPPASCRNCGLAWSL